MCSLENWKYSAAPRAAAAHSLGTTGSALFLSGEGHRSRCYGRTVAMRLIVQPYAEDEDDDFVSFS
jgi:hypothetical protein